MLTEGEVSSLLHAVLVVFFSSGLTRVLKPCRKQEMDCQGKMMQLTITSTAGEILILQMNRRSKLHSGGEIRQWWVILIITPMTIRRQESSFRRTRVGYGTCLQ